MHNLQENVVQAIPIQYRNKIIDLINSMKKPEYMEHPIIAVAPLVVIDRKPTMFYSKLTGIQFENVRIRTSGGLVGSTLNMRIPMPEPIKSDIGVDYITKQNVGDVIKEIGSRSIRDIHNWIYLRGKEIVELKLIEILSVIRSTNLSFSHISLILNNVYSMSMEYKMWDYDNIDEKVIFPTNIDQMIFKRNSFIDITDTPQTEKNVFRLTIGAKVENRKAVDGKYAISRIHAECPVPGKIAPNRLVVQRALTQAMRLVKPDRPILVSGITEPRIETLNLLSARMEYRAMTHEDGIVISRSAANRFKAFGLHLDRIDGDENDVLVKPVIGDREFIRKEFARLLYTLRDTNSVIYPRSIIAKNKFGRRTKSTVKGPSIVTNIVRINGKVFVESISVFKLRVGDKVMDMHGNKGTISEIMPDSQMPKLVIDGKTVTIDIIFPPYTVKRGTPSKQIEEYESMDIIKNAEIYDDEMREMNISKAQIIREMKNGNTIVSETEISDAEFKGDNKELVYIPGHGFFEVPVGIVRVARLNHLAEAKLSYFSKTEYADDGRQLRYGYSMADNMFHLVANRCKRTLLDISNDMNLLPFKKAITALGYELKSDSIVDRRNGIITVSKEYATKLGSIIIETSDIVRNVTPDSISLLDNTIVDTNLSKKFMAIQLKEYISGEIFVDRVMRKVAGGEYILIPPTDTFILHDGTVTLNDVQNIVRRIMIQMERNNSDISRSNILRLLSVLYTEIAQMIPRKSGLLRSALFPRTSFTAYGVIVPNIDIASDEILLPYRMMKAFSYAFNDEMRDMFRIDPTMDLEQMQINVRGYCLATRFPAHRENNAIAFKIRIWNENAIGIHPSIIAFQDGK